MIEPNYVHEYAHGYRCSVCDVVNRHFVSVNYVYYDLPCGHNGTTRTKLDPQLLAVALLLLEEK